MDKGTESYRRFLAGEELGLVELIRDYKDGLILFLNGYTGDILAAEELTEETFVKLAVKRPRFNEKSSFKTWLYAIARNTALDCLRRGGGHYSLNELGDSVSAGEELERAYIREERKITVHRALESLRPEYRQALYLSYFEDFSNGEIASVMKKSRRQVENLLSRARAGLRKELDKEGFTYEDL